MGFYERDFRYVKKKKMRAPQGDRHSCKQDFKSLRQAPDAPDMSLSRYLELMAKLSPTTKLKNYYEFFLYLFFKQNFHSLECDLCFFREVFNVFCRKVSVL